MAWELHAARDAFAKFADDWDRLNARLYKSHPFFDSRFVGPLLEHSADCNEQLCIHRTDGIVSGALILRADGMGRWSNFQPSRAQLSAVLLDDARLLESLFETLPGFPWAIDLYAINPRYSPEFSRLKLPTITTECSRPDGIDPSIALESKAEGAVGFLANASRPKEERSAFDCSTQNVRVFRRDFFCSAFSLFKLIQRQWRGANYRTDASAANNPKIDSCTDIESFSIGRYDLREFAARDTIEVSIDWFDLLQKAVYPDDPGVRYYFLAQGQRPSLILPLRLTTRGRVRTVEALGNYYTSLYTPLLTRNSDLLALRQMLAAATRDHGGAHVMRFSPMDPESLAYQGILNELRAIGWIPLRYFCFGNWFLKVSDNWNGYLRRRSANLRSSIKRRNKEFAAENGSLEIVSGPHGLENAIAAFQEVYSASWKIPEPYPEFVPSLIRRLAALGMLRLGIARLRGLPVAAQLWIVGQDKASIYKVAYHKAFASFSPGIVLTSHLLRHVIEHDRVKEVDFLIGDDEYKPFWMSDRRERWGIVAYNPRTFIGLSLFTKEIFWRIAKSAGRRIRESFLKSQRVGAALAILLAEFRTKSFRFHAAQRDQVMTWTLHPIAQFAEYANKWDALVQSRPGTPFLESAFLQPGVDIFGTGLELLCLLRSNGRLRAATIMTPVRKKGIWQTFQPSQLPLGAWVSDGKVDFSSAMIDLIAHLPGWALGIGASQLDPRIQERPEDGPKVRTQDYIQTAWVDIASDFESYWEARGKNLKQNTRKQRNKLQAEGTLTRIECVTAPEDVRRAIEDYGLLESAGWKAADGTAIHPDNAQGLFYRKVLENYCTLGRGRIYRYWFGEKVVAMDLCIHDQEAIVVLKTAYDESYKTISPSTLMRHDQFQQLFAEKKFPRIEFYGKVMEWHTRWTTQSRTIYHCTVYRWAWLRQLHARLSVRSGHPPAEQAAAEQN